MYSNSLPSVQTIRTFSRFSFAGRQPRKSHRIAGNFTAALGAGSHPVTAIPLTRLISLLDREHEPGAQYAVVSKRTNVGGEQTAYATTVLDVPLGRIYRAEHPTGIARLLESIAYRSLGAVKYLKPTEPYVPPAKAPPREQWYQAPRFADA